MKFSQQYKFSSSDTPLKETSKFALFPSFLSHWILRSIPWVSSLKKCRESFRRSPTRLRRVEVETSTRWKVIAYARVHVRYRFQPPVEETGAAFPPLHDDQEHTPRYQDTKMYTYILYIKNKKFSKLESGASSRLTLLGRCDYSHVACPRRLAIKKTIYEEMHDDTRELARAQIFAERSSTFLAQVRRIPFTDMRTAYSLCSSRLFLIKLLALIKLKPRSLPLLS